MDFYYSFICFIRKSLFKFKLPNFVNFVFVFHYYFLLKVTFILYLLIILFRSHLIFYIIIMFFNLYRNI